MITRGRSTLACLGAGVALVASAGVAPAALGDPTPPAADTQGEVCNKPATLSVAGESGDPTVGQPVTVSGICFPVGEQTRGTVNVAGAESQSEGITSDRNGRVSYTFVPEEPGEHILQIVLQGERNNADVSFDVVEAEPAPDDPEPSDAGGDDSKDDAKDDSGEGTEGDGTSKDDDAGSHGSGSNDSGSGDSGSQGTGYQDSDSSGSNTAVPAVQATPTSPTAQAARGSSGGSSDDDASSGSSELDGFGVRGIRRVADYHRLGTKC